MESFNQNVIKHKTGFLKLAAELGNISKACRIMGLRAIPRHVAGIVSLKQKGQNQPSIFYQARNWAAVYTLSWLNVAILT